MIAGIPVEPLSTELEQGYTEEGTPVATVVVTLRSGQTLRLYEGDHITIISTDTPREDICVYARPIAGAERRDSVTPRIEQPTHPNSEWSYDLYGTVAKLDARVFHGDIKQAYLLDVGVGTVLVHPALEDLLPTSVLPLDVGDALFVPTSRLELHDDQALRC